MSNQQTEDFWEAKREAQIENETDEIIFNKECLSNCCGAPVYEDTDICSDCREHCACEE